MKLLYQCELVIILGVWPLHFANAASPSNDFEAMAKIYSSLKDSPKLDEMNQNGELFRRTALCKLAEYSGKPTTSTDLVVFDSTVDPGKKIAMGGNDWVGRYIPDDKLNVGINSLWEAFTAPIFTDRHTVRSISVPKNNPQGIYSDVGSGVQMEFKKNQNAIYFKIIRNDLNIALGYGRCPIMKTTGFCTMQWKSSNQSVQITDVGDANGLKGDEELGTHWYESYPAMVFKVPATSAAEGRKTFIDRCLTTGYFGKEHIGSECLDWLNQTLRCYF
jgi:hypothetical protein